MSTLTAVLVVIGVIYLALSVLTSLGCMHSTVSPSWWENLLMAPVLLLCLVALPLVSLVRLLRDPERLASVRTRINRQLRPIGRRKQAERGAAQAAPAVPGKPVKAGDSRLPVTLISKHDELKLVVHNVDVIMTTPSADFKRPSLTCKAEADVPQESSEAVIAMTRLGLAKPLAVQMCKEHGAKLMLKVAQQTEARATDRQQKAVDNLPRLFIHLKNEAVAAQWSLRAKQ